jgi:hypothetical protein
VRAATSARPASRLAPIITGFGCLAAMRLTVATTSILDPGGTLTAGSRVSRAKGGPRRRASGCPNVSVLEPLPSVDRVDLALVRQPGPKPATTPQQAVTQAE